mgnify:CR=1 FL=1
MGTSCGYSQYFLKSQIIIIKLIKVNYLNYITLYYTILQIVKLYLQYINYHVKNVKCFYILLHTYLYLFKRTYFQTFITLNTFSLINQWILKSFTILYHAYGIYWTYSIACCAPTTIFFFLI